MNERHRLANLNHSPEAANKSMPDPTRKAQLAFIRATRRGSKKHTSMRQKLELLDSATKAIPQPEKHDGKKDPNP